MAIKGMDRDKRVVVLLIEEDPVIRLLASEFIADSGFEVLNAANSDEAIQILESRDDIRVMFTEINMSGSMDGLKLAHAVRDRWPPIHIVATTGCRQIAERELPPGSRFFLKPYNPQQIVRVLEDLSA